MEQKNCLFVVNYCMDSSHPSLGHQISVVSNLSRFFESITVITTSYSGEPVPKNVDVWTVTWQPGQKFTNSLSLFLLCLKLVIRSRPSYIFSHMAPLHSIVVSPIARVFKIQHTLWYAHAQKPILLNLAVKVVDRVVSSTRGSFPIKTRKLSLLGQGVDSSVFRNDSVITNSRFKLIYAGRMDKSKNVEQIVATLSKLKSVYPLITLTLIGNDSIKFVSESNRGWLVTGDSISRDLLPVEFKKHGTFIHAFIGSLDKVLVEAVMTRMPIISSNNEFCGEFRTYAPTEDRIDLESQLLNYFSLEACAIQELVELNYKIAINRHELTNWIANLVRVIKNSDK